MQKTVKHTTDHHTQIQESSRVVPHTGVTIDYYAECQLSHQLLWTGRSASPLQQRNQCHIMFQWQDRSIVLGCTRLVGSCNHKNGHEHIMAAFIVSLCCAGSVNKFHCETAVSWSSCCNTNAHCCAGSVDKFLLQHSSWKSTPTVSPGMLCKHQASTNSVDSGTLCRCYWSSRAVDGRACCLILYQLQQSHLSHTRSEAKAEPQSDEQPGPLFPS